MVGMRKSKCIIKNLHCFNINENKIFLTLFVIFLVFLILKGLPVTSWGPGTNYKNYSVHTTVNVTNAYPEILNISCNNGQSITLNAGTTKAINCTIKIRDYNGWNDVNYANATFYYYLNVSSDPDDNNVHYTNTSCAQVTNDGQYLVNWTCSFDIWYFAVNGSWRANATVNDSYGAKDNDYGNASISALLALNVTNLIDFGNLAVTETSPTSVQANVTNFGNVPINVSVYGFGGESEVAGAGFAMICQQRNITITNERYDLNSATAYDSMTPLTNAPGIMIPGIKIEKQTQLGVYVINSTYWRLHVNLTNNPFGICNGTVVFSAENS
jgi:hypothetical protein